MRPPANIMGLSPRVRGNLQRRGRLGTDGRSIPACAGEPSTMPTKARAGTVYPRVCGGTCLGHFRVSLEYGLSPRVRGNRLREAAAAGETGLSPRVRGNLLVKPDSPIWHRSIPACAGEPVRSLYKKQAATVYPRVCGGTYGKENISVAEIGLSPRVRGNPPFLSAPIIRAGSIPACAGEPPGPGSSAMTAAVYPRVCGGTQLAHLQVLGPRGLSPRVRGNPPARSNRIRSLRSIPACAGEPV